jgi:hypothetical protein
MLRTFYEKHNFLLYKTVKANRPFKKQAGNKMVKDHLKTGHKFVRISNASGI